MLIMADIAACLQVQIQEERPQQMLEAVLRLLKFFCMLMLLLLVLQLALPNWKTLPYALAQQSVHCHACQQQLLSPCAGWVVVFAPVDSCDAHKCVRPVLHRYHLQHKP
jgi:hypothetical protein